MPAAPGDAVHLLSAEALTEVVELIVDEFFFRFPLQALFGSAIPMTKNKFIIHIVEKIRNLGSFTHEREPGGRQVTRRYGDQIWTAIFQQYSDEIDDHTVHTLGTVGVPNQRLAGEMSVDDAMRVLMEKLADFLEVIMRTNEYFAAQVLSATNPSLTVGNVTETLDFGVQSNDAAAAWTTAGTDIISEFDKWLSEFRQTSGDYPDLVLVEDSFWRKYVVPNDGLNGFLLRHPEFYRADLPMTNFSRPDRQMRFAVQTVPTQYEDSAGDLQDFWPEGIMSFVRLRSGGRSLRRYTVRDKSNNMQGGVASRMWESNDPPKTHLSVSSADFFGIPNKSDVELHDLTP